MALYTAWDSIFNAATAGVLALFGVWVLTLRPRSRTSIFLGLFAVVHGITFVLGNLWDPSDLLRQHQARGVDYPWQLNLPDMVLHVASAAALLGLAHSILVREGRPGLVAWRIMAWAVPVLAVGALAPRILGSGRPSSDLLDAGLLAFLGVRVAKDAFYLVFAALPLIMAWFYRRAIIAGGGDAHKMLTMSVAFVLWPALYGTFLRPPLDGGGLSLTRLVILVLVFATGALWIFNIPLDKRLAHRARNAALLVFALLLFGTIDSFILYDALGYSGSRGPFYGVARLMTVVILAYAILHHQVLGIDVKFRFAMSRGTVAAVILSVIFIASEGAQAMFGDDKQWLGLVAGGLVVFAIAPLQQAADRLAARMVPGPAPGVVTQVAEQHERYRILLRRYLGDGSLTRDEELVLAHAAAGLGIPSHEALRLRHEVEDE